ncbi:putative serine/threonine protein kinase [Sulfurisphaera ohwakuensis]|uniref:Putative serine/threonine protein kinase n=1 Tax=Sulfurisphaera ohwakuensis TaxID=69656 RepID=A0A7J9RTY6_SULOH|nr:putative serine/threonine protein kinase [Sulfurisphaera ohwakuensis]
MDKLISKENTELVKVRDFIYPRYDENIERELIEHGIKELYSFGSVNIGKVNVIGKGKTGIVVLFDNNKVIKIRRSDSPKETLEIEAKIQIKAFPVAPKVYDYGRNFILMEYIDGRHLTREEKIDIIIDLLRKAKELEDKKIEHKELARPYKNVIVKADRVYIIDYDSASFKENPLNVTSILSWLNFPHLATMYKKHRNIEEIISLLYLSNENQ